MVELIQGFADKYPIIFTIFSIMGVARLVMKPLLVFLKEVAGVTPTQKDDLLLASIETSKIYKTLLFLLDWFFSIKLVKKEPVELPKVEKK